MTRRIGMRNANNMPNRRLTPPISDVACCEVVASPATAKQGQREMIIILSRNHQFDEMIEIGCTVVGTTMVANRTVTCVTHFILRMVHGGGGKMRSDGEIEMKLA